MVQQILRRPDVERATGLSRSTLYDMIAKGKFPKPVKLGVRAVGWPEEAVRTWQQERLAASQTA